MNRNYWQEAFVLMLLATAPLSAQSTVRIIPGPQYEASGIKEKLLGEGYTFASSTDTEVIAHLVARSLAKIRSRGQFPPTEPHALLRPHRTQPPARGDRRCPDPAAPRAGQARGVR